MRKLILTALVAAALAPSMAAAQDRELRDDRRDIRQEQRDVNRAVRDGAPGYGVRDAVRVDLRTGRVVDLHNGFFF